MLVPAELARLMRVEDGTELSLFYDEDTATVRFSKKDPDRPYQKVPVVRPKWNRGGTKFSLTERKDLKRSESGALVNRASSQKAQ